MKEVTIQTEQLDAEDCCWNPCNAFPKSFSLAMAYVPLQKFSKIYEPDVGLSRGTIFQCLDKPFIGEEAVCNER